MTFYELLLAKATETIDQITDPVAKAKAIADFLAMPVEITSYEVDAAVEAKPVAEEKAAKPAKSTRAKKTEAKPVAEAVQPVVEAVKPAAEETPAAAVAETVNEHAPDPKPVEKAPEVVEPAPEVVAKVKEAVEDVKPYVASGKETAAERQARQAVLVKAFGDLKLGEVLSDPEKKSFFTSELGAIGTFKNFFMKKFGITVDENGVEHNATQYTLKQVEATIFHYIHECDESGETWRDVKIDKFITVFIPYMMNLYNLFSTYTDEQINEAGTKMLNGGHFTMGRINHSNIDALYYILNPEAQLA